MRGAPYHRIHRIGPHHRPPGVLLLLLIAVLVLGGTLAAMVVTMMLTALPFVLVGGALVFRATRRARRRGMAGHPRRGVPAGAPAHGPHPRTLRPGHPPDWTATKASFAQLRGEYGQFECDPLAVLRLPALTDVSVGSTARFVDAFAEAQALDTDERPPDEHCQRYTTAVEHAWRTWRAALDAAERIRLSGIPAEERATVQRAIKLLTVARDAEHESERSIAYSRARAELAKLERSGTLRLPPTAAAALDAAARAQLPPAPSR